MTDNPLVFPDDGDVLSGGNFHGQPLSLPLDHLALALCELASFAERRTYALLSPSYAGLPPFLTPRPGLSSGLMIAQYAAAALVNECQVLAHPAGAGSIPTAAGQEDFNSMGALRRAEGAHGRRERRARDRHRARVRVPGARVPPPAAHARRRSRRRSRACARYVPRVEEDRSLAGELAALAAALAHRGGRCCVRCRGWRAGGRAADAREQPASRRRRAAGGARRLRRDRQGRAQPRVRCDAIKRELMRARRRRDAARAVGQAGRRCSRRTPTRRAC